MSELVCRVSDFHCFVFGGLMHSLNSGRPCLPTRALLPPRTDTVTSLSGSSRQARNSRGPSFVFCQPMPNNDGQTQSHEGRHGFTPESKHVQCTQLCPLWAN